MSDQKAKLAFEILARENARMLTVYLRSIVCDDSTVDDLFQEAMVVAWKRLDECDLSKPFGPWLRGIASRLVMAHYRKRKSSPVFLDEAVLSHLDSQFESIAAQTGDTWDEKVAALHACLDALPETHRNAIDGRYFEGLKTKLVAENLNISFEACKKRLVRARGLLADCLRQKRVLLAAENSK